MQPVSDPIQQLEERHRRLTRQHPGTAKAASRACELEDPRRCIRYCGLSRKYRERERQSSEFCENDKRRKLSEPQLQPLEDSLFLEVKASLTHLEHFCRLWHSAFVAVDLLQTTWMMQKRARMLQEDVEKKLSRSEDTDP